MPSNTPASRIESGSAPAWLLAGLPTVSCRRTQHNPEVERDLSIAATGRYRTVVGADRQIGEERLTIHELDSAADERDNAAHRRDSAADERDNAAKERDGVAEERDSAADERTIGEHEQAARDRGEGSRDRERAAQDRKQAAERDSAAAERDSVAAQRDSAAAQRTISEHELAALTREDAALDREEAARDRAQAGFDALTGALGRGRGLVDLQREIDRARRSDGRLVLAFVDVDGLKAINDVQGHAAGDQLLRDVALALRTELRSYDLVVRYGGDEFLCTLSGSDIEGARRRFDEVARDLTERSPEASVSVGLAALADPDTLDELIGRADAALYAGRRGAPRAS